MRMQGGGVARKVIIAGAPASGKGTQCELIKQQLGLVHLSTGDMLRAAVKAGTPVGLAAKAFMDSGKLVPDEVIINLVRERLDEPDCQASGWLLDGFPRTAVQAQALRAAQIEPDLVLYLNVPDSMLIERVVGRRLDMDTGRIYHLKFDPPPADIADRLTHRSDDTAEKATVRLQQFHEHLGAILDAYKSVTVEVDGTRPKGEVFETISSILGKASAAVA
ncbi:adenylate kinase-domain-containing protein [Pavlovales sp. CCMP2436]|nr:adenylate kinase-domain-containing protein [Pavlovales sp. CCMP2436]